MASGININLCKDVDQAVELAIYLYSVQEFEGCIELLQSFANDIKYSERSGVWGSKQDTMALLAYAVLNQSKEAAAHKVLIDLFESNPNIQLNDTDWIIEDAIDDMSHYVPKDNWDSDLKLTKNEMTAGHCSALKQFIFPYLISRIIRKDDNAISEPFNDVIKTELQYLRDELETN